MLFALTLAVPSFAQDAGADGGTSFAPDASVGEGGSEREETDDTGKVTAFCQRDGDCSRGFNCHDGRCTWVPVRKAERLGCLAHAWTELLAAMAVAVLFRRVRKHR